MNWLQLGAFIIYSLSALVVGAAFYAWINPKPDIKNRCVIIGEIMLIGIMIIIGEMLFCSLIGAYKGLYLWGMVFVNFVAGCLISTRSLLCSIFFDKIKWDVYLLAFWALISVFIFRNCFFLVDVDSHSTYLYAQKLWLQHGSSIFASPALDMRVFVPHFNAVPYALGLVLFPTDTFFPQLIVVSWTIILLLLIFGYFSYRFNRGYGLAAAMLCILNEHMFYSGVNAPVIINSALIAFMFAAVYSFWESARNQTPVRFVFALIFLSQLLSNKLQVAYVLIIVFVIGVFIQPNIKILIKKIMAKKEWIFAIVIATVICGLWFIKNGLATGNPLFPALAGKLGTLNWSKEMSDTFTHYFPGPLTISLVLKYLSYLFIWPGVNAAKIVWICLITMPAWLLLAAQSKQLDEKRVVEVGYWLSIAVFCLIGICLVSFPDPRLFRYGIALMAAAAIFCLDFILRNSLKLMQRWVTLIIVAIAVQGWGIAFVQGGPFLYPSFAQNMGVLLNKIHFQDVLPIYYPNQAQVLQEYEEQKNKFDGAAAWDAGIGGVTSLSAFLLPVLPQVGIWHTSVVGFDSYADQKLIEKDLENAGIEWVLGTDNGKLKVESIKEYALRARGFERFPKTLFYNYGFPDELSRIQGN